MSADAADADEEGEAGRAAELIRALDLHVLPGESGYLGLVGQSREVAVGGRPPQSQVYYMLTAARNINFMHHLHIDDTHVLIEGGPVSYYVFDPDTEQVRVHVLSKPLEGGSAIVAVPAGCWKALRLHDGASHALMASILSPAFAPELVTIGVDEEWIETWTRRSTDVVAPSLLRELAGLT